MNLSDVLKPANIDLTERTFLNKEKMFSHMARMLQANGFVSDADAFIEALEERERTGSTYMGNGLAVPHGRSSAVKKNAAALCRCKPFWYKSNDEEGEVRLIMMLAISDTEEEARYLRILANLSRLMLDDAFYALLLKAQDGKEIVDFGEKAMARLAV